MKDFDPEIILSDKIKLSAIDALNCQKCGENLKKEINTLLENANQKTISFELVKQIHEVLRTENDEIFLHTLIEESDIFLPSVPPTVRNPELQARIDQLKVEEANREYKEMTKNVNMSSKHKIETVSSELKNLNRQLIAVFNFIVTVGGAFAFGYKAVEYSVGDSLAMQMMCGLIFATVVFFADLYFLLKYST